MKTSANIISNYTSLLQQVKQRVALAQQRAIYAANEELLRMYWDIGQMLHDVKNAEGWGKGTLVRLSQDLKNEYPKEKGFSERNLRCMVEFYLEYNQDLNTVKDSQNLILQPAVAELPVNKTIGLLLCKTKDKIKAEYALRDIAKPIGISDYELGQALPRDLRSSLPSIEDIEAEFDNETE